MYSLRHFPLMPMACTLLFACGDNNDAEKNTIAAVSASVRVAAVERAPIQSWVFGEGTARAVGREFLSFESAGRIAYVDPALKEGDAVTAGQVIAYQQQDRPRADLASAKSGIVDARTQLAVSKAALTEANAAASLAQKTSQRFATLIEQNSASQQEFDEANLTVEQGRAAQVRAQKQVAAAEAQIDAAIARHAQAKVVSAESKIVAPIDGVLARLNIEQGYYFSPQQIQSNSEAGALNTVPVVIIDPTAYEITVQLPSFAHSLVAVGNAVLIDSNDQSPGVGGNPGGPGRSPESYAAIGTIYAVSPSIDPSTRTFAVKIRTIGSAEHLQDGEFVTTWIGGLSVENAVAIPLNATRFDNGMPFVFVYDPATFTVARRSITLGLQGHLRQQVIDGLDAGMQVVTEGRSKIADGDRVRLVANQTPANVQPL